MLPALATMLAAVVGACWALWKRRWMLAAALVTYLVAIAVLAFEILPPIAVPIGLLASAVVHAATTRPFEDVDPESLALPTPAWLVTVAIAASAVGSYFAPCR